MKVSVTQYHIDSGRRGDICECPVALALKDAGVCHPIVRPDAYLGNDGDWHHFSQEVSERIAKYDKTGEMEPFDFEA